MCSFYVCKKGRVIEMLKEVIEYFPISIKEEILQFIKEKNIENFMEEIRFRTNQNLTIKIGPEVIRLNHKITKQAIFAQIQTARNIH